MAELDLTLDEISFVISVASCHHGFTNSEEAMMELNYNIKDQNKKQVGLRTKRVLDLFSDGIQNFKDFLTHNTTQLQLS